MVTKKSLIIKDHTIQELKQSIQQAPFGCCFSAQELLLLLYLLPKQENEEGERIMITCALPKQLINSLRILLENKKTESVSFCLRLGLLIYGRTQWIPPLPNLPNTSQKVDYSFRVEKNLLKVWQTIPDNKVKVLESWGWFFVQVWMDKLT